MSSEDKYSINKDILFDPLTLIDIPKVIQSCKKDWQNNSLCIVNDCVVRLGVIHGEFHWHKHDREDEFFYVIDGKLLIDLENGTTVEEEPSSFDTYSDTRYKGIEIGDSVIAVGVVVEDTESTQIKADFIARGTQESYVASQRSAGVIFFVISIVVAVVGSIFIMWDRVSGLLPRRRQRSQVFLGTDCEWRGRHSGDSRRPLERRCFLRSRPDRAWQNGVAMGRLLGPD